MNKSIRVAAVAMAMYGVLVVLQAAEARSSSQALEGARFRLRSVDDSTAYFAYRYVLLNPASSAFPAATAGLDLADSNATAQPARLPSSGTYDSLDARIRELGTSEVVETVPVGSTAPSGWLTFEMGDGAFSWWNEMAARAGPGGVAPGDSLGGFVLRSTHLPALRDAWIEPNWAACCGEPWGTAEENPDGIHEDPWEYGERFPVVGPTHAPGSLSLVVLGTQLASSCTTLGWITNPGICNSLQVKLNAAQANLASGNQTAAGNELQAFANELDALNVKFISPEAYWMLKINAEALAADPR